MSGFPFCSMKFRRGRCTPVTIGGLWVAYAADIGETCLLGGRTFGYGRFQR
jgi:hypothetical protein